MRYDLYYIKNRSLRLDARILLETVGIILFGQGSSGVRATRAAGATGSRLSRFPCRSTVASVGGQV